MTAATSTLGRDSRVLGLIGLGHCLSHFYPLLFAPLIIVWHAEFGASYAALGASILFVLMIDMGATSGVYWVIAAFNLIAIATVTSTRWVRQPTTAEQAAE